MLTLSQPLLDSAKKVPVSQCDWMPLFVYYVDKIILRLTINRVPSMFVVKDQMDSM